MENKRIIHSVICFRSSLISAKLLQLINLSKSKEQIENSDENRWETSTQFCLLNFKIVQLKCEIFEFELREFDLAN